AAGRVLAELVALAPPATQAPVQVAFGLADLAAALAADLDLAPRIGEPAAAAERALLLLHDLEAIQLQHGLAVFRQAMTLRLPAAARGAPYPEKDCGAPRAPSRERPSQVHARARSAELGRQDMARALAFADDSFQLEKRVFPRRHFPGEAEMLARATGRES